MWRATTTKNPKYLTRSTEPAGLIIIILKIRVEKMSRVPQVENHCCIVNRMN